MIVRNGLCWKNCGCLVLADSWWLAVTVVKALTFDYVMELLDIVFDST